MQRLVTNHPGKTTHSILESYFHSLETIVLCFYYSIISYASNDDDADADDYDDDVMTTMMTLTMRTMTMMMMMMMMMRTMAMMTTMMTTMMTMTTTMMTKTQFNYETKDEASDDNHCFELHINRHSMLF